MSNYQTKDNSGVLFKNDRKETEKHPDHTGTALIGGVEYFIDAWVNVSESGRKYQKFSFKRKEKQGTSAPAPAPRTHGDRPGGPKSRQSYDESDIPF